MKKFSARKLVKLSFWSIAIAVVSLVSVRLAFAADAQTVGEVASQVVGSMSGLSKLINAGALVAGMGFAVGAVLKFKQHKDNPTQIPVGTPVALVFIAAALLFLPSVFGSLGKTLFGDNASKANLSGDNTWIKK